MKRKVLLGLVVVFCFSGCTTPVTQKGFESLGSDIYENFVYFVSKDVFLRESVTMGEGDHVTQNDAGKVILIKREIIITTSTRGRVVNASATKFDVAFEELPEGGGRPYITFIQDPNDSKKRYFIDTSNVRLVNLVKEQGEYGYITKSGPIIPYIDRRYLIEFNGAEPPFLIQKLDIGVKGESRKVKGLR